MRGTESRRIKAMWGMVPPAPALVTGDMRTPERPIVPSRGLLPYVVPRNGMHPMPQRTERAAGGAGAAKGSLSPQEGHKAAEETWPWRGQGTGGQSSDPYGVAARNLRKWQ